MVILLHALRVWIVLAILAVLLFVITDLTGNVIRDDFQLAHAIAHKAMNPTEATRKELRDAEAAARRLFMIEYAAVAFGLICLGWGLVATTRGIRVRTSNKSLEATAGRSVESL